MTSRFLWLSSSSSCNNKHYLPCLTNNNNRTYFVWFQKEKRVAMMTQRLVANTRPSSSLGFEFSDVSALAFEPTPLQDITEIDCIVDAVDKLLDYDDDDDVSFDPTPIGTHGLKIVERVSLTESPWVEDEQFSACLSPFLKIKKLQSTATMPTFDCRSAVDRDFQDVRKRSRGSVTTTVCKRHRVDVTVSDDSCSSASSAGDSEDSSMLQLRPYQSDQWYEKFQKLVEFKRIQGHCLVPNNWGKNEPLALWVKRQRYQYKLKREGQHSTLTEDREAALEDLGFVWDSHGAVWEERLAELKTFKAENGHSNVPAGSEDRTLAIWVKCQRRQYKLFCDGQRSNMTEERIVKLKDLGFVWNPRKLKTTEG